MFVPSNAIATGLPTPEAVVNGPHVRASLKWTGGRAILQAPAAREGS